MPPSHTATAALVLFSLLAPACTLAREPATVSASGERDGLTLHSELSRKGDSFFVDTAVRNTRSHAVHLDSDQCGRVTEVVLARTVLEPEGERYTGSLGAVKEHVLDFQRSLQNPHPFHPRRVTGGPGPPKCVRPEEPVTVDTGETIEERWELPFEVAYGLQAVGSEHTVVRAEVVESEAPGSLEFLDMLPTGEAEDARNGRNLRVEQATSKVLRREAPAGDTAPSLGQAFDRMIQDDTMRSFIVAQPADSWRRADLVPWKGELAFSAVTTGYEREIAATVSVDGGAVRDLQLPRDGDRTRAFKRRLATLPPGVARIPEEDDSILSEDVIAEQLVLPSGRVAPDAFFGGETETLSHRAEPGSYPVHVTLARYPGTDYDKVALASLVVSDAPTVEWREEYGIAVDGGTAGFISAEGSEALGRLIAVDDDAWSSVQEAAFDSLTAHDDHVTEFPIDGELNLVMFSTGYGDGGYPVFVGLDASGKPTRFVMDFGLVHLDWPQTSVAHDPEVVD